jgi:hypothetical protein
MLVGLSGAQRGSFDEKMVREGIEVVGRELICGLTEWVRRITEKTGRVTGENLAWIGGREMEEIPGSTLIWKPTFMHRKRGREEKKGDGLEMLMGEWVETILHAEEMPREIERLKMSVGGDEMDMDGEEKWEKVGSEENGVSIEGEFTFSRAVIEFLREEVRNDGYKENYVLNLKD